MTHPREDADILRASLAEEEDAHAETLAELGRVQDENVRLKGATTASQDLTPGPGQENGNRPHPPSDDHPGGPLSRAERVVLSGLRNTAMRCRCGIRDMYHVIGAVPGAQKIEEARTEALAALDRFLLAIKTRKQGTP